MALGTPTLAVASIGTSGTSDQTVTFTPPLGALLVSFAAARAGVLMGALVHSASALTWTELTQGLYDVGAGTRIRAACWATVVDVSVLMWARVDSASAGKTCISVIQITGASGLPSNAASAADAGGDPVVTLGSAPAAASTVLSYIAAGGAAAITAPAGYTQLDELVSDADLIVEVGYDAASAAASAAWTTSNVRGVGLLVEVSTAGGGAGRVPIRPARRLSHMIIR